MAKDRIDRNELADKLVETANAAEDPLRAMAEMIADFVMEAGVVTQKIGAEPHERSDGPTGYRNGHRERRRGAAGHAGPKGAEATRRRIRPDFLSAARTRSASNGQYSVSPVCS